MTIGNRNHVCSFELSKALKELGVKQESLFYWVNTEYPIVIHNIKDTFKGDLTPYENGVKYSSDIHEFYAAFSASQLGELLPRFKLLNGHTNYFLNIGQGYDEKWEVAYENRAAKGHTMVMKIVSDDNLASALAKMLIHFLENNLMELPK